MIAWLIAIITLAVGYATDPAIRLAPSIVEDTAGDGLLVVGPVAMPWTDHTWRNPNARPRQAIDACEGAILYWHVDGWAVMAAHNRSCPSHRSGRHSLVVDHIVIDGVRHELAGRTTGTYYADVHADVHRDPPIDRSTPAVILQTSTGGTQVTYSWFVVS